MLPDVKFLTHLISSIGKKKKTRKEWKEHDVQKCESGHAETKEKKKETKTKIKQKQNED